MRAVRRQGAAVLAVIALGALGCTGLARACVPYPIIVVGPQSSGPSGTAVKVSGVSFAPGQIEVRWNSIDGPMLGTARDPDFSVDTRIPEADEGLYAIVALTRDGDGGVSTLARAAFLVTGPDGKVPAPAPAAREKTGPPESRTSPAGLLLAGGGLVGLGLLLGAVIFRKRAAVPGEKARSPGQSGPDVPPAP